MLEASNPDGDGDEPEGGDRYLLHSVKGLEGLTKQQLYNYIFSQIEHIIPINIVGMTTAEKKALLKREFGDLNRGYFTALTPIGEVFINKEGLLWQIFIL